MHGTTARAVPVWSCIARRVAILRALRSLLPKWLPRLLAVLALLLALLLLPALLLLLTLLLPLWLILCPTLSLVGSWPSAGIRSAIRTRRGVGGSRRRSTTGAHMLRGNRRNAETCTQQRKHKSSELEFSAHASLHLLIRLTGIILLLL
jgi:hypothetical protein